MFIFYLLKSLILVPLDALLEHTLEIVGHVRLAAISPQFMDSSIIVAIHLTIIIAILIELLHIVLHQIGGTVWIIGAVDESLFRIGMLSIYRQFASIHPVSPGDAEYAACSLFRTGANRRGIATTNGLTNAGETQLRYRLIQHMTCLHNLLNI